MAPWAHPSPTLFLVDQTLAFMRFAVLAYAKQVKGVFLILEFVVHVDLALITAPEDKPRAPEGQGQLRLMALRNWDIGRMG